MLADADSLKSIVILMHEESERDDSYPHPIKSSETFAFNFANTWIAQPRLTLLCNLAIFILSDPRPWFPSNSPFLYCWWNAKRKNSWNNKILFQSLSVVFDL